MFGSKLDKHITAVVRPFLLEILIIRIRQIAIIKLTDDYPSHIWIKDIKRLSKAIARVLRNHNVEYRLSVLYDIHSSSTSSLYDSSPTIVLTIALRGYGSKLFNNYSVQDVLSNRPMSEYDNRVACGWFDASIDPKVEGHHILIERYKGVAYSCQPLPLCFNTSNLFSYFDLKMFVFGEKYTCEVIPSQVPSPPLS